MEKEAKFLFTVTVGMPCWGFREYEPLIIALFLPIVPLSNWKGTWTIRGNDWVHGAVRGFKLGCYR